MAPHTHGLNAQRISRVERSHRCRLPPCAADPRTEFGQATRIMLSVGTIGMVMERFAIFGGNACSRRNPRLRRDRQLE